jgi:hypothetical protein
MNWYRYEVWDRKEGVVIDIGETFAASKAEARRYFLIDYREKARWTTIFGMKGHTRKNGCVPISDLMVRFTLKRDE